MKKTMQSLLLTLTLFSSVSASEKICVIDAPLEEKKETPFTLGKQIIKDSLYITDGSERAPNGFVLPGNVDDHSITLFNSQEKEEKFIKMQRKVLQELFVKNGLLGHIVGLKIEMEKVTTEKIDDLSLNALSFITTGILIGDDKQDSKESKFEYCKFACQLGEEYVSKRESFMKLLATDKVKAFAMNIQAILFAVITAPSEDKYDETFKKRLAELANTYLPQTVQQPVVRKRAG